MYIDFAKVKAMKKIVIITVLLLVSSCDMQTRSRYDETAYRLSQTNTNQVSADAYSVPVNTTTDEDDDSTESTESTLTIPEEVSHCAWSTDGTSGFEISNSNHLGPLTICQDLNDDSVVYLQLANTITGVDLCLVPIYISSSNSSVPIGEPRCLQIPSNTKIYTVKLLKNRQAADGTSFESFNINGIMAMKDVSYTYLYKYVNSYGQFVQQYVSRKTPDALFDCSTWLETYSDSSLCQYFEQVGQYVYYNFPTY
jgi:hypothetical protein